MANSPEELEEIRIVNHGCNESELISFLNSEIDETEKYASVFEW